ncbi:putative membrane protein [Allonocardiopsis opalescens]|uniref:Putative membrane protein n=2 Tax=Allonocardiopsis opalescens TaxID=1144618 RepID=A0A2T0PW00_9ACTN|nr:putative membrane protein [Allonocardiopsis opalescens]
MDGMDITTLAQPALDTADHFGPPWGGPGPGFLLFPLTLALIALAVWLFRRRGGGFRPAGAAAENRPADPVFSARQILAERYARGEIDDEEYLTRLSHLGG